MKKIVLGLILIMAFLLSCTVKEYRCTSIHPGQPVKDVFVPARKGLIPPGMPTWCGS